MTFSEQFVKTDFAAGPFPEVCTVDGVKVPPDGPGQPVKLGPMMRADSQPMPIGLSYPAGRDFGPYVQRIGEGFHQSFSLDFANEIPYTTGNVHPHTGLLLYSLILNQRPSVVLETGTWYGYSTWMMAQALRAWGEGMLYSIDCDMQYVQPEVHAHPHVKLVVGHSQDVLPGLLAGLGEVQFAFLDSWKRLGLREFYLVHPFIPPGGIVAFHDTQFLNTGRRLYDAVREVPGYDVMLFAGTPHRENGHRYFGNADDRGLLMLRKREADPFLNVRDCESGTYGDRLL